MYLDHFGFEDFPFIQSSRQEFFFHRPGSAARIQTLQHWMDVGGGTLLLAGEPGVGRTSLFQYVCDSSKLDIQRISINLKAIDEADLLEHVAAELELDMGTLTAAGIRAALRRRLQIDAKPDKRVILLLQQAGQVSCKTLWQLHELSQDTGFYLPVLQTALTVTPAQAQKLGEAAIAGELPMLQQVINVTPLSVDEIAGYIEHRLSIVNGQSGVRFDTGMLRRIHRQTGGIALLVNRVCDRLLCEAAAGGSGRLLAEHFQSALNSLCGPVGTVPAKGRAGNRNKKRASARSVRKTSGRSAAGAGRRRAGSSGSGLKLAQSGRRKSARVLAVPEVDGKHPGGEAEVKSTAPARKRSPKTSGNAVNARNAGSASRKKAAVQMTAAKRELTNSRQRSENNPTTTDTSELTPAGPVTRRKAQKVSSLLASYAGERSVGAPPIEYSLNRDVTVIGKAADCNVQIDDDTIGPYQALIVRVGSGFQVRNEDAQGKLLLNDQPVRQALLHVGDILEISGHQFSLASRDNGDSVLVAVEH